MRPSLSLLLAVALALPACAQETDDRARTHLQAAEPAPAHDLDPEFDPQKERETKEQWQEGASDNGIHKEISEIDWAEANSFQKAELAGLGGEQRARLLDAPVPALLPDRAELFDEATVTSGEHWYAVSLDGEAHSVYVSGTRLVTVVAGLELGGEAAGLKDDFRISRTDGIVSLSVNAFGAAYTIDVECARPGADARCVEDDYVVSLANALVLPKGEFLPKGEVLPEGEVLPGGTAVPTGGLR